MGNKGIYKTCEISLPSPDNISQVAPHGGDETLPFDLGRHLILNFAKMNIWNRVTYILQYVGFTFTQGQNPSLPPAVSIGTHKKYIEKRSE